MTAANIGIQPRHSCLNDINAGTVVLAKRYCRAALTVNVVDP